jgi:hypothetical protein
MLSTAPDGTPGKARTNGDVFVPLEQRRPKIQHANATR